MPSRAAFALGSIITALVLALGFGVGLPRCGIAAALYAAGVLVLASTGMFIALLPRICKPSLELSNSNLLVSLGACGSIRIPLNSVQGINITDRAEPVLRLTGTSIPGHYYSGVFSFRGGGRALVFATRLRNLAEIRLISGERILVDSPPPRELDSIKESLNRSSSSSFKTPGRATIVAEKSLAVKASLLAVLGSAILVSVLAPTLPPRAPLHYGVGWAPDRWGSPIELLAVLYTVIIVAGAIAFIAWRIRDPVSSLILSLASTGLSLLLAGLAALSSPLLCTIPPG